MGWNTEEKCVIGRSMERNLFTAIDLGYIQLDKSIFIDPHEVIITAMAIGLSSRFSRWNDECASTEWQQMSTGT